MNDEFSDEYLNAFTDGQLDAREKEHVLGRLEHDRALRERMCDLCRLKEEVRLAYPLPSVPGKQPAPGFRYARAMAACFLLVAGCILGWGVAEMTGQQAQMKYFLQAINRSDIREAPGKIIVQVSDDNPVRLKTALDEAEDLLVSYRQTHRPLRVELIASESGINMFFHGSPYAGRIAAIKAKYGNIDFLVCSQALRKQGMKDRKDMQDMKGRLLPNTRVVVSAINRIVKRLSEGWDYVRV